MDIGHCHHPGNTGSRIETGKHRPVGYDVDIVDSLPVGVVK
jgi:hypothetical protein